MQDNASTTEKRQIEEELEALREVEEGINQKSIQEQLKLLAIAIRGVKRAKKRLESRADLRVRVLEGLVKRLTAERNALLQKVAAKQVQRAPTKVKKVRRKPVLASRGYEEKAAERQKVRA